MLSSPKPASPLLCLTPARNWGASLPLSFTPPERSHPSCPFNFLNHLRVCLLSTPRNVPPGSSGPRDDFSSVPRLVPADACLGWELLAGLPGEWAAFACPAVAFRVAVASSAGPRVGNTPSPHTDLLCLRTHGLGFYTDRLTRPLGPGDGALGCASTPVWSQNCPFFCLCLPLFSVR